MLLRLRKNHPIVYCLLAEAVFLVMIQMGGLLVSWVRWQMYAATGGLPPFFEDSYAMNLLGELPAIATALVLLWRTQKLGLLTRRGCGFLDGLLVGMFLLAATAYTYTINFLNPPAGSLREPWQIACYCLSMFMVGIAEELLGRGVVAQTMLETFGFGRAGVWKACIFSGLLFGACHLTNLLIGEPFGVLMQVAFTSGFGVLLAAVYFRTGNLWVTVFLHTVMNIGAAWTSGVYNTSTMTEIISGYNTSTLVAAAVYALPAVFLLRKKKLPEVALYFGPDRAQRQA